MDVSTGGENGKNEEQAWCVFGRVQDERHNDSVDAHGQVAARSDRQSARTVDRRLDRKAAPERNLSEPAGHSGGILGELVAVLEGQLASLEQRRAKLIRKRQSITAAIEAVEGQTETTRQHLADLTARFGGLPGAFPQDQDHEQK
jgi:chromosome segregation ATPase